MKQLGRAKIRGYKLIQVVNVKELFIKTLQYVIGLCLLLLGFVAHGKDEIFRKPEKRERIIEASKMLDEKMFQVRLYVMGLPTSSRPGGTEEELSTSPIGIAFEYTDDMKITYGGKNIFVFTGVYLPLFDPSNIASIGITPDKLLYFDVRGGDGFLVYRHRIYSDPRTLQVVKVESLGLDGTPPPVFTTKYIQLKQRRKIPSQPCRKDKTGKLIYVPCTAQSEKPQDKTVEPQLLN
jgi:hypothetical protein